MLTSLTAGIVKRVLKSEETCKPFDTDGAGTHSADHQSISPFLLCISADFGVLMNPPKMLCNGAKLCSSLGSWPACALVQLLIAGIVFLIMCAR